MSLHRDAHHAPPTPPNCVSSFGTCRPWWRLTIRPRAGPRRPWWGWLGREGLHHCLRPLVRCGAAAGDGLPSDQGVPHHGRAAGFGLSPPLRPPTTIRCPTSPLTLERGPPMLELSTHLRPHADIRDTRCVLCGVVYAQFFVGVVLDEG